MTEAEKIIALRAMTGSEDAEEILTTYLNIAANKVLIRAFPYDDSVTVVPRKYESTQLEIAAYLMNKRGAEGQTIHSENGIYRMYENADVPASMLKCIVPMCGVIK